MSDNLTKAIVNQILLVEDDRDEAEFLKSFLEQHRIEVHVAKDAGQAHSAFTMRKPDLVLLDLILPNNVSGFEVCERMKHVDESVPILVLSAIELEDSRDLAERVGVDGYVTKPYDPDELLATIRQTADGVWQRTHLDADDLRAERVRFECPECGKRLKVSAIHRGHRMNCPKCGATVVVPRRD
ncbi:MAG: response regulator [Planctomycetaceae bacterium]|nr:response regulator [Planctomycetaceae bacterium]